jgi:hypothetical protein
MENPDIAMVDITDGRYRIFYDEKTLITPMQVGGKWFKIQAWK